MSKLLPALKTSHLGSLLLLLLITTAIYYKFFFQGKIPFPGDLLVSSYSPWFDYYKVPIQNPLISDIFSQFFLWKYLAIESLKNLQWPLWDPYSFSGTPLLATYHSGSLYPLNLLLLLPKYSGWGFYIFSQSLIASFGMYLLLSSWMKSKIACCFGSLLFAFGGLMTTWAEFGTAVHALAWLPLSIYSVELFVRVSKIKYLLILIVSFTLLILAGNAQIAVYSLLILIAFTMVRVSDQTIKKIFQISLIFLSILLSISISAPQLVSSYDLLQKSVRLTDSYIQENNFGLLPVKEIFKLFSADFFGNPVTRNYWGFLNYSETSSFLGTISLPLLIFSFLFLKRTKITIFFQCLLMLSLFVSFDNPLSQFIYQTQIPLLTLSYASRMLFITTLSAAVLTSFSINQILSEPNQRYKITKSLLWSVAAFTGIALGVEIVRRIIILIIENAPSDFYRNFYLNEREYSITNYLVSLRNVLLPNLILYSSLFFFLLVPYFAKIPFFQKLKRSNFQLPICALFLLSLLIFDLGRYFLKFNPFVSSELIFPKTPSLEYLQKQPGYFRVGREHAEVLPPNTWAAYQLQSIEGYNPLYLSQYAKFMHLLNGGDLRTGSTGRYAELSSRYDSPYIDAANVKYFIGIGRDRNGYIPGNFIHYRFNEANYKVIFQDRSSVIVENPNALERVYFAPSFIVKNNIGAQNIIMEDLSFNPREQVIVPSDVGLKSVSGKGEAVITKYTPNTVEVKTYTDQEELLVLADQYDEGWRAKLDNKETQVIRANLIFRAIRVPSGSHQVTFYYWPNSFDFGLKISFLSLLTIIVISAIYFGLTIKKASLPFDK